MSDRCAWVKDAEIGKFFLPGCIGGAVYGLSGCTCERPPRGKPALLERVERLEALVDRLLRAESGAH